MSLFSGNRTKDLLSKKANFYVEFLGWMETNGLRGERYTEPVVKVLRQRQQNVERPPKLTIQVSKKEVKISQDVEEKKKRSIKKIKFPTIPSRDVTFAVQSIQPDGRPDDTVAIIYLGYMPRTQRYVHAHVYRFDEAATAATFVDMINQITDVNAVRIRQVEKDLAEKGQIEDPRRQMVGLNNSDGMSDPQHSVESPADSAASNSSFSDDSPHFGSDEIDPDLQSLSDVQHFDSVTDELQFRLKIGDAPLLLPPKDYDTVHRQHGNLAGTKERRCLNMDIIGGRERNGSGESGIDLNSPTSDTGSKLPEYTDGFDKNMPVNPIAPELRQEFTYPFPSPTSPLNNRRSVSSRDLDSPRSSREFNGYGPNSPSLRRNDVFQRQHSTENYSDMGSPGLRRHEGLKKSSSYNHYASESNVHGRLNPSHNGDSGPNSPRMVAHGRQTSQSSMYSSNSYKSDGSRGSRGSNEREEVMYPSVEDTPPADYDRTMGPEMRRKVLAANSEYMTREELTKSYPQTELRRELGSSVSAGGPRDLRRSQNMGNDVQYMDVYNPRVKRGNSMYR
ncbi:uncharacterized protein [Haliotis cracherodii]|uniref:uncharacterized protein n=1 Tax=Haliotis cracherodii TaxID=6455 RepID=UPI0039EB6FCA